MRRTAVVCRVALLGFLAQCALAAESKDKPARDVPGDVRLPRRIAW